MKSEAGIPTDTSNEVVRYEIGQWYDALRLPHGAIRCVARGFDDGPVTLADRERAASILELTYELKGSIAHLLRMELDPAEVAALLLTFLQTEEELFAEEGAE